MSSIKLFVAALFAALLCAEVRADVQLPAIFQDHMVLQRDAPVTVWGTAVPHEKVTVTFHGAVHAAIADREGKWKVALGSFPAGGPLVMIVEGNNRIVLSDILLGDVWICGGQSNMQWKVSQTPYHETDSAFVAANRMRFFTENVVMDYVPGDQIAGSGWKTLTAENIADFSAVAFHFGHKLQKETGVPIGLISANLGATSVETWMSNEALMAFAQFREEVAPRITSGKSFAELQADFEKGKGRWDKKAYYKGVGMDEQWFLPATDISDWTAIAVAGNTWTDEEALKYHDGAVWFRTTFDLPEGYSQEHFLIQLGQIDDYDIAWVNGKKIGESFGRHNHRNYSVPVEALKQTDNVLVVRVFDKGGIGGFTTSAFWASSVLKGKWLYKKGALLGNENFSGPVLPNATPFSSPGVLFNGMIAPLTSLPIKGAIFYQGESNAARAYEYRELFPAMIRDWRAHWGQGDFPFFFVQLANYMQESLVPGESEWAELREAKAMALALPNTGMATAIDIGEANDIHPKNKVDVGSRLALAALSVAYGQDVVASGPSFKGMTVRNGAALISFDHIGGGLRTRDKYGYVRGFQIAGADKTFHWAKAHIEGDHVVVSSDAVRAPVAVRYAWADNPGALDLYNAEGLPALPFRTDNWEGRTSGKVFQEGPRF